MIQNIRAHNDKINSIAVTPDGNFILTAGNDKTIRLWGSEDGVCCHVFQGHIDAVNAIAVTPDSQYVVSGSKDCTLKLWDIQNGECLRTFEGHSNNVNAVAVSPDGSYTISGCSDGDLRKWNLHSGDCLQVLERHPAWGDRDGLNRLIRSSNSEFSFHDFIGHLGFANTYSNDRRTFFGHADPVKAVSITPDARFLLSGSEDNTLRLWRINTGECLWIFGGYGGGTQFSVTAVAITPNGKYVISASESLQAWRLTSKKIRRFFWGILDEKPCRKFKKTSGILVDIAITPNGKHMIAIMNNGESIGIYKTRTGKLLRLIRDFSDRVNAVAVTPDGRLIVAGCTSGIIRNWSLL